MSKDLTTKATDKIYELLTEPLPEEFTDQMVQVYQMRLRGLKQTQMAEMLGVSQPRVARIMKDMRKIMAQQTRDLDQEVFIGETVNIFKEAQYKAWELYALHKQDNPNVAAKALDIIMSAQEKSLKALADVGIIRRAAVEHEHQVKVAPFVERFESLPKEERGNMLRNVIEVQMAELEEPEPPQLEDGDIEDGDIEDETED